MKRLLSFLMVFCMMLAIIPGAAFAEGTENTVDKISGQQVQIFAGVDALYSEVYTISFGVLYTEPKAEDISVSFNLPENAELDVSGISVSKEVRQVGAYDHIVVLHVSVDQYTQPGVYFFTAYYKETAIYSESSGTTYSSLTILAPSEAPIIEDKGRSLSVSELIYINDYVVIHPVGSYTSEYIVSNGGLLVFNSSVTDETGTFEAAQNSGTVIPGLKASSQTDVFSQRIEGVGPRNYNTTYYLRIYLSLSDGSYVYGPVKEYSVFTYCNNKINDGATSQTLKTLCQAIMSYGDAATAFFELTNG